MADNNRNRGSFYASDENWDRDDASYRRESQQEDRRNTQYGRDDDDSRNQGSNNSGYGGNYGQGGYSGSNQGGGYRQEQGYGRNYGNTGDDYRTGYGGQGGSNWQNSGRGSSDYGGQGNYGTGYGASGSYGSDYGNYGNFGNYRYGAGGSHQQHDQDYQRTGGGYGQQHQQHRGGDWRRSGRDEGGQYGGRHRDDRGWWDKTRDEVSSWFGDDDADRRRRQDHVREGQHKGKGPRNYQRSEDRIREDVCDRLCDDPYVDASEIDVRVSGNEVILTGTVESREDKRRAEELAERISGVSNVQNQLRVGHATAQNTTTIGSSEIRTDADTSGNTGRSGRRE